MFAVLFISFTLRTALRVLFHGFFDFVFIEECGSACDEQRDRLDPCVLEGVSMPARDKHCVTGFDFPSLVGNGHQASTRNNVIYLLDLAMMVRRNGTAGWEDFFSQAALSYVRSCAIDKRPQLGAVSCFDGGGTFAVLDNHGCEAFCHGR